MYHILGPERAATDPALYQARRLAIEHALWHSGDDIREYIYMKARVFLLACTSLSLAACSGGGNNPTPPNPPWSKVAAHVLRLAGILAYLDWAWRTAGRRPMARRIVPRAARRGNASAAAM